MTLIAYANTKLSRATLDTIDQANAIIEEYSAQGFTLILRQLYYQFVARDLAPNTIRSYKRIGEAVKKGRRCGLISWDAIEDRTRNLNGRQHWNSPREVIEAAKASFAVDMWANQRRRPECWIEKDALVGVIAPICRRYDVPFFACRGNNSDSEAWAAGHHRFRAAIEAGQDPLVLHLGDHDPNGLDMTRDNRDRLQMFAGQPVEVRRLALNMDQVREHRPPPNPAKPTDTRYRSYAALYGTACWELDALDPKLIASLIEQALLEIIDPTRWAERVAEEGAGRDALNQMLEGL